MQDLPFRQIHLDFHTSPDIPDVGSAFDPQRFADTLQAAHVDSVTVFARGHHGMCYYDTQIGPKHPSLEIDLLGEMIEACHDRDIRVPAYITVAWDEWAAHNHPEWAAVNRDGSMWLAGPTEAAWHGICLLNEDYQSYLLDITEEVLENYEIDGLFMDIWSGPSPACFCWSCLEKMQVDDIDIDDDKSVRTWNEDKRSALMARVRKLAQQVRPDASVFFNSCLRQGKSDWLEHFTHIEIESLPTGGWSYAHFPLFQRYFRNFDKPTLGMTARFHRTWGDFGGLKNQAALEFECFSMLAGGAHCSVGDQLHPRGKLDPAVYDLIGNVYESVQDKEPWCVDAQPVSDVAVFYDEAIEDSIGGAVRGLLETHELFDVVDNESDFGCYQVLILPDGVRMGPSLVEKIQSFLRDGGKLIASGKSGMATEEDRFVLPELGVEYIGPHKYDPNFICQLDPEMAQEIGSFKYMMYDGGCCIKTTGDANVLARVGVPYFNRSWKKFCSHGPTPFDRVSDYPAIVRNENVVYFAHPLFQLYADQGARLYRQLMANALTLLRPEKYLRENLPSTARVGLLRQEKQDRLVLHILNYVPERRTDLDVIEEAQTVLAPKVRIRTGRAPKRVYTAPEREKLDFTYEGGYTVPELSSFTGHEMVIIEFGEI
ncbi:MAG: alpha-L-fucosidase [Candidatus Brocadiia bacterium]